MVHVHLMRAGEGDFIWLNYGDNEKRNNLLIDGGVKSCGEKFADVIRKIANRGETIDAIILTHIDCDHIAGACEGIARVETEILQKTVKKIIFNASKEINKEILVNNNLGVYGVNDGIEFWEILKQKKIQNRMITEVISGQVINLDEGAVLKIISPGIKELKKLYEKWEKYEEKHGKVGYAANTELVNDDLDDLMNYRVGTDNSVNNASSIAFLFEYNKIRGAFLADAKPSVCIDGLRKFGIKSNYKVDFIKLSHHGSRSNTNQKLLDILVTENYLLSTNGNEKKVPSKVVIAKLLKNCLLREKAGVEIYCNYDWWGVQYHNRYFTNTDKERYVDSERLKIQLLNKDGIEIKDGLILYGKD